MEKEQTIHMLANAANDLLKNINLDEESIYLVE